MKKILFASTALVATAGVAAAELTIDGSARFGLAYTEDADNTAGVESNTRIEQRMRVNITGIAETDAGVKLEARFRLESNEDANSGIAGRGPGAAGFAVSYGGLRVDVGNVSDVLDSGDQVNYYGYGIGFTSFLEQTEVWYDTDLNDTIGGFGAGSQDATTIKARYTVGDFSASLSYTDDKTNGGEETQLGLGYTFANGMAVGAVYGTDSSASAFTADGEVGDYWVLSVSGSAGALGYSAMVGDADTFDSAAVDGGLAYGISVNYEVSSATAIQGVISGGGRDASETAYGLGFTHGLGGGVTLAGGVGSNSDDKMQADLGVKFKF